MTVRRIARWSLAALLLATLSVTGCGKKGGLEAPEDKKDKYTYPRQYPR